MKISRNWLARYVDLSDRTAEQIRDDLTMSTAEIEGVETFGGGLESIVVGHVLEHGRHPDADKLSVNRVAVGDGEPVQIICGAPNIAAGQNVPVVLPGSTLPGGLKIKKSKIRGVESFGMVCSESELGLSEDQDGIMVLAPDLVPGQRFADAVAVRDEVFEIDNKSVNHRPDLWGHYGFARELAAILGRPLLPLPVAVELPSAGESVPVLIEDQDGCTRFTSVVLDGVDTRRSPDWLRWLLAAIGQRPLNLLVDLTNFAMFDTGQPLHAFDRREVDAGGIVVRRARPGEVLRTIDEIDRQLLEDDIVVTSGGRPVALAGIMGGTGSAVRDDTVALVLESAHFRASRIRRTSSRLGLRTEASARFEKSLDPALAELGSRRFVQLAREFWPGADARGPLVDPAGFAFEPPRLELRRQRLQQKLGVTVPDQQVEAILGGLQFGVEAAPHGWTVAVPSFRASKDIAIEDDLIEEVGRMFRYDNIPEQPLVSKVTVPPRVPALYLGREMLRIGAAEMAFHEVYNYSFVADALLAAVGAETAEHCRVSNPVAPELTRMRRHVLPSVLGCVAQNLRERTDVRLMELGKGYHPEHRDEHGLPREVHELAFAWSVRDGETPYPRLRSQLERLLRRVGHPATIDAAFAHDLSWLHPTRTAAIVRGEARVGHVGLLHPAVARSLGLPATTVVATLDLAALVASGRDVGRYRPIPRFPGQPVDLALLVPESARVADIAAFVASTGKKLVRSVELFEVYRGPGLPDATKSLNFTVTLGAHDRTLETKDEERFLARIRDRAATVGAQLRG